MTRLIVMACSATKSDAAEFMTAKDRYTGPVWQTLKAVDPRGELAHVTAFSAEYGWIDGAHLIRNYDRKMDTARAAHFVACADHFEQLGCPVLDSSWHALLTQAYNRGEGRITEICIVGGHLYQAAARAAVETAIANCPSYFDVNVEIVSICDQIGYMRRRLREYLLAPTATMIDGTATVVSRAA
jgi:hypothetical protein